MKLASIVMGIAVGGFTIANILGVFEREKVASKEKPVVQTSESEKHIVVKETISQVSIIHTATQFSLEDISLNGNEMHIVFSNWSSGCLELLNEEGKKIGNRNVFCENGDKVDKVKYEHIISPGDHVLLCERMNTKLLCTSKKEVKGIHRLVTLDEVILTDRNMSITYSKDFETCADLQDKSNHSVFSANLCRASGNKVNIDIPSTELEKGLKRKLTVGEKVRLCHGNNGGVCSNWIY